MMWEITNCNIVLSLVLHEYGLKYNIELQPSLFVALLTELHTLFQTDILTKPEMYLSL